MRAREFIIPEAMTRSQYRVLRNKSDFKFIKDRYNEIFDGKWRVSIPFDHYPDKSDYERFKSMSPEGQESYVISKCNNIRSVQDTLIDIGYDIVSYINGLAVENERGRNIRAERLFTKGKPSALINTFDAKVADDLAKFKASIPIDTRPKKIGSLLQGENYKEVLKLFVNDPVRKIVEPSKKIEFSIVISRHPVDIGAMSTNQKWSSCMRLPNADKPKINALSLPAFSTISTFAPSIVPIVIAPFIMNFILPVPDASLDAVEICSEISAAGISFSAYVTL
jgi:hypothetical protein